MAISQIYDMSARQVWVGRYDEHGSREVAWDVSPWTSNLGSEGVFALLVTRPRDTDSPYNAQVSYDATTNLVTWAVTDIDTALKGWGRAELHYYVDGALVKSQTFVTIIEKAMFAGSTAPSAAESWVERMEQAALDAQAAAGTAEDAETTATSAATTATSAAATATNAANSASSSASSARADATTATNAATAAALSESAASTSATNAAASAEAASTSALTASTAASTATTKASQASASASTAATSATTATNKASEATTAATTATTKAAEASTSASTATSAKDTAVSASQTATSKATEATTAAATATSAATTATTAKNDAVSAKTAAQTAQTGAETAAASVQSSAAQIATNTSDISQLKEDLSQLSFIETYNPKDHTTNIGEGYNTSTGVFAGTDTHSVTFPDYVELKEGATTVVENTNATRYVDGNLTITSALFYQANKTYISRAILLPQSTATIPANAKYVRFAYTIQNATMTSSLVDTFGTVVKSNVNNINTYVGAELSKKTKGVFYVGSNRTGENTFTTLKGVTEYIWNNGIYDATVYVDKGTYNLETEFGSEWLEAWVKPASNPTASGLKVGNRTHYIFEHGAKILFNYSGSNTDIATAFSPINIAGSCVFDNMQIEAQNCRYCVHEDFYTINTNYTPYQVIYNNCEMLYHAKTLEGGTNGEPIGAGCMPGSVSIINGGCFINEVNQADISYHNYSTATFGSGTSMVVIKNAYMAHWCGFGAYGDSVVYGYVSGCRMKMDAQNGYANNVIRQWGNTIET